MKMNARSKRRFFSIKAIRFGLDARLSLYQGIATLADAVEVTLGPRGKTVILQAQRGEPYPQITRDGFTVAKSIQLADPFHNLGAQFARYAAVKTNESVGDGTTTVIALFRAMFREGLRMTVGGLDPFEMRRGMDAALEHALGALEGMTARGEDRMYQVALVASRGDAQVAGLVADVLRRVGREGSVSVERGHKAEHGYEFVQGYRYDRGLTTSYFAAGSKSGVCELSNPLLLLTTLPIRTVGQVQQFLEAARAQGKSLFIVADEVENEVIAAFLRNNAENATKVVCGLPPEYAQNRRREMNDISVLTQAIVVDDEMGMEWATVDSEVLGAAKKVIASAKSTVFVAHAQTDVVRERVAQIRAQMALAGTSFERGEFERRLARLSGGVAVLRAGGRTIVEMLEAKDRMEDALHAATWARDLGVLVGGGTALAKASRQLDALKFPSLAESCGVEVVRSALRWPLIRMAENAGLNGRYAAAKVAEAPDTQAGFCFASGKMADMRALGVYDSAEVVKTALKEAVALAGLLLTAEAAIVDVPRPNAGPEFPTKKEIAESTISELQGLLGV